MRFDPKKLNHNSVSPWCLWKNHHQKKKIIRYDCDWCSHMKSSSSITISTTRWKSEKRLSHRQQKRVPSGEAFALPRTSQQTGLYHSADNRLKTLWGFFDIPIGSREKYILKLNNIKLCSHAPGIHRKKYIDSLRPQIFLCINIWQISWLIFIKIRQKYIPY